MSFGDTQCILVLAVVVVDKVNFFTIGWMTLSYDQYLTHAHGHITKQLPLPGHSRPQSPSFLGHVVGKRGYKLSRVALGTRMLPGWYGSPHRKDAGHTAESCLLQC